MQWKVPIILACCLLQGGTGSAQGYFALDDEDDSRIGLHVEARRQFYPNFKLASFERFQSSYNTVNKASIKTPMGNLRPAGGWAWGGGVHAAIPAGAYYFNVMFSQMDYTAKAVLNNGDEREMRVVLKPVDVSFDLLLSATKYAKIGMALGWQEQKHTIYSGYRYKNGFLSYANDQALNGIFRCFSPSSITLGGRLDVHLIRQARLSVRGEYIGAFAGKKDKEETLLPHKDQLYVQAAGGSVHNDGHAHYYLVEDVTQANNLYWYEVGQGSNFGRTFRGWRWSVGLVVDLVTGSPD